MPKFKYSTIRFVPSPIRGEFVNLGIVVGSDESGDWEMEIVSSKTRATRIDDADIFPSVAADLQRFQTLIEDHQDPNLLAYDTEISEGWLADLARDSQSVLQFTEPMAVLGVDASDALQKLWSRLIVEHVPTRKSSMSKSTVRAKFVKQLENLNVGKDNLKRSVRLEAKNVHTAVDVAVHNGVVRDLAQCWSFQVKDSDELLDDVKSWAWTIRNLRKGGGAIDTGTSRIEVPKAVNIGVIYAEGNDRYAFDEASGIFEDIDVDAKAVRLDESEEYAKEAKERLSSA